MEYYEISSKEGDSVDRMMLKMTDHIKFKIDHKSELLEQQIRLNPVWTASKRYRTCC